MVFTEQYIKSFLSNNPKQSQTYRQAKDAAEKMLVHSKGRLPKKLLEERRPHETEAAKAYRLKIFEPITKGAFGKIVNVLKRIPKAEGYYTKWPDMPALVAKDETLKHYCEEVYPGFVSIEEWMWKYALSMMVTDPNALMCVFPINMDKTDEKEYYKPFVNIYESAKVVEFTHEQYAILKEKDNYIFVDTVAIYRYKKVKDNYVQDMAFQHKLGVLPVKQMGGFIEDTEDGNILYESFIAGILPHFNEAIREYSDIQAEVVLHMHSERWSWAGQECKSCAGVGFTNKPGQKLNCDECSGTGYRPKSPFSEIIVKSTGNEALESKAPIPPAGYIQKSVDIVKIQDERIKSHINEGYAAINFEFISTIPANQSGIAKDYDRQELEGFLHSIASNMVDIKNWSVKIISLYRYSKILNKTELFDCLPIINVPCKFDVESVDYKLQVIKGAKDANIGISILRTLSIDFVNKTFSDDPEEKAYNELCIELDPLFGYSIDDKTTLSNTKAVTNVDIVISANISSFVDRALDENEKFASLEHSKQMEIIEKYAQDKIDANNAGITITAAVNAA